MKNKLKFFGIIVIAAIIGFSLTACGEGKGDDDWAKLVGEWRWEQGSHNIKLVFNPNKIGTFGYSFIAEVHMPPMHEFGGSQFFCSYIGTTLRVFDVPDITEYTYTVTISSDNQTITFSNYKEYVSKDYATNIFNGKTFTRVK